MMQGCRTLSLAPCREPATPPEGVRWGSRQPLPAKALIVIRWRNVFLGAQGAMRDESRRVETRKPRATALGCDDNKHDSKAQRAVTHLVRWTLSNGMHSGTYLGDAISR